MTADLARLVAPHVLADSAAGHPLDARIGPVTYRCCPDGVHVYRSPAGPGVVPWDDITAVVQAGVDEASTAAVGAAHETHRDARDEYDDLLAAYPWRRKRRSVAVDQEAVRLAAQARETYEALTSAVAVVVDAGIDRLAGAALDRKTNGGRP